MCLDRGICGINILVFNKVLRCYYFFPFRHVLFAESSVNVYAGSSFPGLIDSTFEISGSPNEAQRWEVVQKHYSAIIFAIQSATSSLRDVTKFMPVM